MKVRDTMIKRGSGTLKPSLTKRAVTEGYLPSERDADATGEVKREGGKAVAKPVNIHKFSKAEREARWKKEQRGFAQIDNGALEDQRLSFKAKGLLAYLLSRAPGWIVRIGHLAKVSRDGIDAIQAALRELAQHGYARLVPVNSEQGRFDGKTWQIYELPQLQPGFTDRSSDMPKNRQSGKPTVGKSGATNTEDQQDAETLSKRNKTERETGEQARLVSFPRLQRPNDFYAGWELLLKLGICQNATDDQLTYRRFVHWNNRRGWIDDLGRTIRNWPNAFKGFKAFVETGHGASDVPKDWEPHIAVEPEGQ